MVSDITESQTTDGSASNRSAPAVNNSRLVSVENNPLKAFVLVIVFAAVGTLLMYYLDAYERLYQFGRAYPKYGFEEIAVFLPSFLSLGLLLFSYRQILVLKKEMQRRIEAEKIISENEQKFRALSITDALTRLYNQRHFYQKLAEEMDRALRYDKPLSLLFLDIDDFKRYNDKYGHLEGDKALVQLSRIIRECMRNIDLAFRYGGEEFSLILPETSKTGAISVADRIRSKFEAESFIPDQKNTVHITVSIGIARFHPGEDRKQFISRADWNMYMAKRNGKNRIFTSKGDVTHKTDSIASGLSSTKEI